MKQFWKHHSHGRLLTCWPDAISQYTLIYNTSTPLGLWAEVILPGSIFYTWHTGYDMCFVNNFERGQKRQHEMMRRKGWFCPRYRFWIWPIRGWANKQLATQTKKCQPLPRAQQAAKLCASALAHTHTHILFFSDNPLTLCPLFPLHTLTNTHTHRHTPSNRTASD